MEKLKARYVKAKKCDGQAKKYKDEAAMLRVELKELIGKFEATRGVADRATVEWQSCEEFARELKVERDAYASTARVLQRHVDDEVVFLFQGLKDGVGVMASATKSGEEDMGRSDLEQVGRVLTRLEDVVNLGNAAFDARGMELSLLRMLVAEPFICGGVPAELVERLKSLATKMNELGTQAS